MWSILLIIVAAVAFFFFKKNSGSRKSGLKIKATMEFTDSSKLRSSALLKEATAKKKSGDLEGAVDLLRQAYSEMKVEGIDHGIESHLRLPMYLSEAGKRDEAWAEFNRLLLAQQEVNSAVSPMSISTIYGKMALSLQRQGRAVEAVKYEALSYLSWARGLALQEREEELEVQKSVSNIEGALKSSLKKAKLEALLPHAASIVNKFVQSSPNIDMSGAAKEIDVLVNHKAAGG